ncbi:MAG TPA: hypothetical protein VM509_12860 [Planctomycetota bacterium]|nr:hypothetical protein [Planctomycetota bacterium]
MKTKDKFSLAFLGLLLAAASCESTPKEPPPSPETLDAWSTIYTVLQHPRCLNCHPSDGIPKQGDDSHAHGQNVKGGADGHGRFALRCESCHRDFNVEGGPNLPPGAPGWHMPPSKEPLVFEGRSSGELCKQLKDPARNGGMTPEQLYEHMEQAPLVLWGWSPGQGRTPVAVSHEDLLRAMRAWIDGGCGCPE